MVHVNARSDLSWPGGLLCDMENIKYSGLRKNAAGHDIMCWMSLAHTSSSPWSLQLARDDSLYVGDIRTAMLDCEMYGDKL